MKIEPFKLEEFWKIYEFTSPYLLCASDAETWSINELLSLADPDSKKLWETMHLGYTESPGHPLLREEISSLYTTLKSDNILTVAGGEEGIYCAIKSVLSPDDHAIVVTPCYQSLETIARTTGADITRVPLEFSKGWKLDIEHLKKAFRPTTKLLLINYPHNPTGALLEKEAFNEMIMLARAHGTYIFCDEMYRFMEIDERDRLPSIADAYEKGIALFGMTKPFGLSGLRIGWLASQDKNILQQAGSYKLYLSICNSAPSEIMSIIALRAKDKILGRNRSIMLDNIKALDGFFAANQDKVTWKRPQSGTVAVAKLLLPIPIDTFTKELVENTGVLIMPGSVIDLPDNYFRIGFGRKNMPEILVRFAEYLRKG